MLINKWNDNIKVAILWRDFLRIGGDGTEFESCGFGTSNGGNSWIIYWYNFNCRSYIVSNGTGKCLRLVNM